jgi:hypothetical protein
VASVVSGRAANKGEQKEMLDEKTTLENITYRNGKVYSRKDHQKAIENLAKGRIISAQRRKAEPTISKIARIHEGRR